MRISDWSSDVCSSDLAPCRAEHRGASRARATPGASPLRACRIAAFCSEEEDELRLPGKLPSQCDSLCPGRVSLAGLRLPRASWSAADAKTLRMRDEEGNMTRPCGL